MAVDWFAILRAFCLCARTHTQTGVFVKWCITWSLGTVTFIFARPRVSFVRTHCCSLRKHTFLAIQANTLSMSTLLCIKLFSNFISPTRSCQEKQIFDIKILGCLGMTVPYQLSSEEVTNPWHSATLTSTGNIFYLVSQKPSCVFSKIPLQQTGREKLTIIFFVSFQIKLFTLHFFRKKNYLVLSKSKFSGPCTSEGDNCETWRRIQWLKLIFSAGYFRLFLCVQACILHNLKHHFVCSCLPLKAHRDQHQYTLL